VGDIALVQQQLGQVGTILAGYAPLDLGNPQGHLSKTAAKGSVDIEPLSNYIEQTPAIRPATDLIVAISA